MKKNFYIIITLLITAMFVSCNKQNGILQVGKTKITNTNPVVDDNIPYTDSATLNSISKTKGYVGYKIAHKLAVIQMNMSIDKQMNWNGTKLSKLPVVVYDAKSNPRYYEFIVKKQDGTPIGTLTTDAKNEVGACVAYLLPYVRNYNFVSSKGAAFKMISDGYPNHILVGIPGKGGNPPSDVIDATTGQSVNADTVLTEDAQGAIAAVKKLPQTSLDSLHTNAGTLISGIQQRDQQNQQQAAEYWTMVDSLNNKISNLSDDSLNAILNTSKGSYTSSDQYIIPPFQNSNLQGTFWDGWCGPSAIALIYRAYYNTYHGFYLPLENEADFDTTGYGGIGSIGRHHVRGLNAGYFFFMPNSNKQSTDKTWVRNQSNLIDGGLYYDLADYSGMFWWRETFGRDQGPTLPWNLSNALSTTSNGHLFLNPIPFFTMIPLPLTTNWPGHVWLRNAKTPLLCWTNFFSHYQVAIGSQIDYWNWTVIIKIWFIHIQWSGSIPTGKWLLMQDNGYKTGKHGYRPYWKNDTWNYDVQFPVIKD